MTIIVEYCLGHDIGEFALPMGSKIEAELYIQSKFKCTGKNVYECSLDDYVDRYGNAVYFRKYIDFTLNDFRFLTVDEYVNEIMLYEK